MGFGLSKVRGRSLVPSPPHIMHVFIQILPEIGLAVYRYNELETIFNRSFLLDAAS